ncbi:MAG: hypothetical protein HYZ51_01900 [Candidatus Doudnabacteria bacterium]|nr:hypothetical protein [Candidatus Doudnabacteria bacterium]
MKQKLSSSAEASPRSFLEQVSYLFGAVLAGLQRQPGLPLYVEPEEPRTERKDLHLEVSTEEWEFLCQKAVEYGMKEPALCRCILWTALKKEEAIVRRGKVLRKEEFIVKIVMDAQFRASKIQ